MPTFVDALLIQVGFDTSELKKGQKEASSALRKTKEEVRQTATDIESSGKSAGEAIEGLSRRFIALFALLAGARSIKDFTAQIVGADSAIGRLAANLGTTPDRLDAMTSAVERNGGSAGAAASSFRSLSDSFEELKNTGNTGILVMLQRLQGQGGATIDMMHGFEKALPGIVNNLTALKAKGDTVGANWFGRQLGIDEETVNFLQQGWPKVQAEIEKSKRLGVVSPESAAAAQKMMQSWMSLQQAARDLGRTILTDLSPPIQHAMDGMTAWVEKNKGWIDQKIGDAVRGFGSVVSEVAHSPGFQDLIQAVSDPSNWKPFTDWVREMGRPETWKEFKGALAWLGGQLKEIRDAIRQIKGFINWADQNPVLRKIDEAAGLRAPAADGTPYDPMALGNGPYAKPRTVGGNLLHSYRSAAPRFLGGYGDDSPRGRHPRPGKVQSNANARAVIEELRKAGYNDNAIAAVVGSMQTESSFNPRAHNSVAGGHTGAWQWDSTRWPKVANWIKSQGGDPYDYRWQAKAWIAEHNAKPGDAIYDIDKTEAGGRILKNNPTLPEAIHGVRLSERFGAGEEGGRAANAEAWLPTVKKPSAAPAVVAKPGTELPLFHPNVGGSATAKAVSDAMRPIPPVFTRVGLGAPGAAAAASISNDHRSTSNSSEVNVGKVEVHTQASDSTEIAKSIKPAIERHSFATHANYGPA